jgi:tetratricopeptide (TPR) repeat protein
MYLDYFNKALTADPHFAPAIYQLYYHHFNTDPAKAMQYFKEYTAKADPSPAHQYAYTDLLYLNKDYDAAITQAKQLLNTNEKEPRLYKMLAYSYAAKSDTAIALDYMQQYFGAETDSNLVIKDFETIADLYMSTNGKEDSALVYLEKAVNLEKDATVRYGYFKKMADVASGLKNYPAQANYLKQYYIGNATATNVDLFNWGLAHYRSGNYIAADSVFALYVKGHPDQGFGYIWQARSQSAMDKEMKEGKAIPFYQKLIEVVDENKDDETHKKWLVEAYGYLAAYETNTEKDFAEAVNYFEKLLEVDPGNEDAKKYITMLEKKIEAGGGNK